MWHFTQLTILIGIMFCKVYFLFLFFVFEGSDRMNFLDNQEIEALVANTVF